MFKINIFKYIKYTNKLMNWTKPKNIEKSVIAISLILLLSEWLSLDFFSIAITDWKFKNNLNYTKILYNNFLITLNILLPCLFF